MSNNSEHVASAKEAFLQEANAYLAAVLKESERGKILVTISYLDELLARAFKAKMHLTKDLTNELFKGFGPLSTLSARTKIAYALGWIGEDTNHDLNKMRSIRNEFAHGHTAMDFSDPSVAARCGELRALKLLPSDVKLPALFQFLFAGAISVLRLDNLKRSATMATVPAEPDLGPILPGLFAELSAQQSS